MHQALEHLSTLRFGLYTQPAGQGDIPYLQIRQFNDLGQLYDLNHEWTDLDDRSNAHLLQPGDILFAGKGNRLFAWLYDENLGPCIASSVFFVITPDQSQILPRYLTALLNAPQSKAWFQQIGAGTNIFSIRKSELGAFEIPVPSMERQEKIAALAELYHKSIALTQELIATKQELYSGILSALNKK